MSLQACEVTPWEWLAAASLEALEASRTDDVFRHAAAMADVEAAKDACAMLGALLVRHALERGGLELQRLLSAAFGGLARAAHDRATAAGRRAQRALEEVDAMKCRIRELEKRLDDRTFGVGRAM